MTRFGPAFGGLATALLLLGVLPLAAAQATFIRGAGATFPFPLYAEWAAQYRQATGVAVTYEPVGSGAGVDRIERRLVDFGASDTPLGPADLQRMSLLQFPAVIGGVVPVVNVPGIKPGELRLSGPVLAEIYLGKVRKWNDPSITELNPALHLPNANITVVHRLDSSGTSFLWSEFLSRSSPAWKARVGGNNLPAWPTGVAAVGNQGVASLVQRTRLAIGYVEYIYAKEHRLIWPSLRNRAGEFVSPRKDSFSAAMAMARWQGLADLGQELLDAPGAGSWPITGASFILIGTTPSDLHGSLETMKFFDWAFGHGGPAAEGLDYVPMPAPAVALVGRLWAERVKDDSGIPAWEMRAVPRP
jgi:phosphate transport system substrate-binding protein